MAQTATDNAQVPATRQAFEAEDLRSIASFDDAKRLLLESGQEIADASHEIGDGFTLLEDKDALIKQPFLILTWTFSEGDYIDPETKEKTKFCTMRVVTADGKKYIVNDGGTGIARQVRTYQERTGRTGGLLVERGLRKSDYVNEYGEGTTHYLNV